MACIYKHYMYTCCVYNVSIFEIVASSRCIPSSIYSVLSKAFGIQRQKTILFNTHTHVKRSDAHATHRGDIHTIDASSHTNKHIKSHIHKSTPAHTQECTHAMARICSRRLIHVKIEFNTHALRNNPHIYAPSNTGFQNKTGAVEDSHAVADITLWNKDVYNNHLKLLEQRRITNVILEFAGDLISEFNL